MVDPGSIPGRGTLVPLNQVRFHMDHTISSNHFSVDQQMNDALDYLRVFHTDVFCEIRKHFPDTFKWEGSWLDTDAMGVDQEYSSWLIDAIEATDLIYWEEGEPWAVKPDPS
jgi:hypothetical protein